MNVFHIVGNLARDPFFKEHASDENKDYCSITVAVDGYGKNGKTEFLQIDLWGKRAQNMAEHCEKGRRLEVSGRMRVQTNRGEDGKIVSSQIRMVGLTTVYGARPKKGQQADPILAAVAEKLGLDVTALTNTAQPAKAPEGDAQQEEAVEVVSDDEMPGFFEVN
jgi:single-strand DNA-binding protein